MVRLLSIFGLLSVLFRAATLSFQSLTIGGIVFVFAVARRVRPVPEGIEHASMRWISRSAVALAVTQIAYVIANTLILMRTVDLPLRDALGATFAIAGTLATGAAVAIIALAIARRWRAHADLLVPAAAILAASVMTSHSVSRLDHRVPLIVFTALHQGATATWIGGLPYLLIAIRRAQSPEIAKSLCERFSRLALISVGVLLTAGIVLGISYVGSWNALYGTNYGIMVGAKIALFGLLLMLGALNFFLLRQSRSNTGSLLASLSRFGEAEIGIGFTVILAAASLTSLPPAVDFTEGRVTAHEIIQRMTPQSPRLVSPPVGDLAVSAYAAPGSSATALPNPSGDSFLPGEEITGFHSPGDQAWSDYNHNWSGLVVISIGFLALLARSGRVPWARHWPLLFLALAAFLFLRSDPENWPLGPYSFWQSLAIPEVFLHRVFTALLIVFAIYEWRVRTGRQVSDGGKLVFPMVCALAGALLLTHTHSLGNFKEEVLVEWSHAPLAILGVTAGWSRWLELRLPGENRVRDVASWIWPACFFLIGAILLNYHEGLFPH